MRAPPLPKSRRCSCSPAAVHSTVVRLRRRTAASRSSRPNRRAENNRLARGARTRCRSCSEHTSCCRSRFASHRCNSPTGTADRCRSESASPSSSTCLGMRTTHRWCRSYPHTPCRSWRGCKTQTPRRRSGYMRSTRIGSSAPGACAFRSGCTCSRRHRPPTPRPTRAGSPHRRCSRGSDRNLRRRPSHHRKGCPRAPSRCRHCKSRSHCRRPHRCRGPHAAPAGSQPTRRRRPACTDPRRHTRSHRGCSRSRLRARRHRAYTERHHHSSPPCRAVNHHRPARHPLASHPRVRHREAPRHLPSPRPPPPRPLRSSGASRSTAATTSAGVARSRHHHRSRHPRTPRRRSPRARRAATPASRFGPRSRSHCGARSRARRGDPPLRPRRGRAHRPRA